MTATPHLLAPVPQRIRAITLDLDDTLWPVWPTIERAEAVLHDWLTQHAPATAARFDVKGLRALRNAVGAEHPDQVHDLSWLRKTSLERALALAGEDPALAHPAFEVFFDHRQRVTLFDEVPRALAELARRYPVLALTNGNSDLQRIGLAQHFQGVMTAREFGVGKPAPVFFHAACEQLGLPPEQVLHVGDDWALDVEGAHAAGLPSVWLHRAGHPPKPAEAQAQPWLVTDSLDGLLQALS